MNNKISIIIPCYNSLNTIQKTIDCIKASIKFYKFKKEYELIVVNDGSNDSMNELLKNEPQLSIINHQKNLGLAAARNTGIKNSTGSLLIFIDSDIYISENWISEMMGMIDNNNIIGITGALQPSPKKNLTLLEKYLFSKYRGDQITNQNTSLNYKSFVFSNTIIKKDVLEKTGLFDETLKHYGGEDTELAIRINKLYPSQMRKNHATSIHDTGKTLKEYLSNLFEYGQYNFLQIVKKHPDYKDDLGYKLVSSLLGRVILNNFNAKIVRMLLPISRHPLLVKFLVINSFIGGARLGLKNHN